ncbi:hypothetical protein BDW62DRAFT_212254 [Aspergillus aurantiobrunneus]
MSPLKDTSSTSGKESAPNTPITRRSRTMPIDSPTAKFLYTIIKQLDLKGIDWALVASQLEISNGHAARMRYHRFRNQMEGINPTQRKKPANKSPPSSKTGTSFCIADLQREASPETSPVIKSEPLSVVKSEPSTDSPSDPKPYIKSDPYAQQTPSLADIPRYVSPMAVAPYPGYTPSIATPYHSMNLAPELRMYSPMPAYPPVPGTYEQGCGSPVNWTPVKIESRAVSEECKEVEKVEAPVRVKKEVVPEE